MSGPYNGLGRYEDALPVAQQASDHPEDLGFSNWGLSELIVAAARSGKTNSRPMPWSGSWR